MTRTNIEIDDELVARVMERYELKTKKEAVDLALRQVAGTTDCLIAAIAWRRDATLVHADVDFDRIAARYPVQVMSLIG